MSDGGLFAALAESCMAGRVGADVRRLGLTDDFAPLLGEEPSRVVLSFAAHQASKVEALAKQHQLPLTVLGEVGGDALVLTDAVKLPVDALHRAHRAALEPIVGPG